MPFLNDFPVLIVYFIVDVSYNIWLIVYLTYMFSANISKVCRLEVNLLLSDFN